MAYQRKLVYEAAWEFKCSENELMEFLKRSGVYLPDGRNSFLTDNAYNHAKKYFLGVPTPATKPKSDSTIKIEPAQKKIMATFDYKPMLSKYDEVAIKKSPIKY